MTGRLPPSDPAANYRRLKIATEGSYRGSGRRLRFAGAIGSLREFSKSALESIPSLSLKRSLRLSGPCAAFGSCFPQRANAPAASSILDVDRNAQIGRNENDFLFRVRSVHARHRRPAALYGR